MEIKEGLWFKRIVRGDIADLPAMKVIRIKDDYVSMETLCQGCCIMYRTSEMEGYFLSATWLEIVRSLIMSRAFVWFGLKIKI